MKHIIKNLTQGGKTSIREQKISDSDKRKIGDLIITTGNKVKSHYISHFSKPETINKFNKKENVSIIKNFIPTIGYKPFLERGTNRHGYVSQDKPKTINLNLYTLITKNGGTITTKGSMLYDTILHEMGHLIDYKLQSLREKTISSSSGYYQPTDGKDNYVQSDIETFARIQRLREVLELSSTANGVEIRNRIIEFVKSKKIYFPNVKIMTDDKNPGILIFELRNRTKGVLTDLWGFYSPLKINNTSAHDISALFAKYSKIENGRVILDLNLLGKVNVSTKGEIKLTESDLMRIVKRVIEEQINETNTLMTENKIQQIKDLVDKTGTYGTVEAFGGFDDFYRYISSQGELGDILVFMIKKLVDKLSKNIKVWNRAGFDDGPGFNCMDTGSGPFYFDTVECEEEKTIEFFGVDYAEVNHYFYDGCDDEGDPVHSDDMDIYNENYENFSDSVLTDMLEYLLQLSESNKIY